jgi:twinkle protein
MTTDVMTWLEKTRGLRAELLWDMGVKPVDHPHLGVAIAFGYTRHGKHYADKFRGATNKKFLSTTGVTRGVYCEDNLGLRPDQPIVITEGEIDCLSVIQAGYERTISVPDGWTANGGKTDALIAVEDRLRQSPYVVVAGDNDEAGASMPRAVANLLKGHDVRCVTWPDGCKDANDVLVKFGEGALAKCIVEAKRIDPPGGLITGFSDLPPLSERRVLRIGGGYPFDVVALEIGAMSVWTGIPGHGKSTFLTWVAEKVTLNEKIRCGMMAFETHAHKLRDQLSLIRTGRRFMDLDEPAQARLLKGSDGLDGLDARFRLVHVVMADDVQQHLKWLEEQVYTLAVRDQCKLIIVDPWNELEHLPEPGENMTNYINFATKFLRQMAERLEVHIALVAHPKKMGQDSKPRAPNGYDIADSAAFFNKPSLGVTVHKNSFTRDDDTVDSWVELHVWKVRDTLLYGFEPGLRKITFDHDRMNYEARS